MVIKHAFKLNVRAEMQFMEDKFFRHNDGYAVIH